MRVSSRAFLAAAFLVVLLGSVPAISARQTYPPSEAITYTDIFGGQHSLRAFSGRKVRYALPEAWVDGSPQSLTPSELVSLIKRTDRLYELTATVVASEPRGAGVPTIAAIPLSSGEGGEEAWVSLPLP